MLIVSLLCAAAAEAQTTAADGVGAILRGDYATAVRVLRPLAEESDHPDPLALFFLGSLYETGSGVPANQIRACGLYLKAANLPGNPLASQSLALATSIHRDDPALRDECVAASGAPWHDPPAASFTLGPAQWVRIDRSGFVVGNNGEQKAAAVQFGGPGWVFLPTRHTQLDMPSPAEPRRHFIEFFAWERHTIEGRPTWVLWWSVFEIVGLDATPVVAESVLAASEPIATIAADTLVRLYVNADGEAAWAVSGDYPRGGFVRPHGGR
jgi:hypothetical protein